MEIQVNNETIILTTEIINRTRQHFINVCLACIDEVITGKVKVNDINKYITWQKEKIEYFREGKGDSTLHFCQMAYYFQSGISVPILN